MRKRKKIKLTTMIAIVVSLLLVAASVIIFIGKTKMDEFQIKIQDLEYELESNTVTVYVASRDIRAGERLVDEAMVDDTRYFEKDVNIHLQETINGLPDSFFMQPEDLGSQVTVHVSEKSPIMKNMVAKTVISTDLREYEISAANLMTDQQEFDYVDVRILFPDGSDFLILPKKEVKNLRLDSCVFYTYCNEDEILRFSSAIIDAFTTSGAYIYTTRYVESSLQDEAIPYYPVRPATLSLLQSDPNILSVAKETLNAEARMNLATRLSLLTEDQLEAVADGFGLTDTARGAIFQERVDALEAEEEEFTEYNIEDEADLTDGGVPADGINETTP